MKHIRSSLSFSVDPARSKVREALDDFFQDVLQPALDKTFHEYMEHADRRQAELHQFLQDWLLAYSGTPNGDAVKDRPAPTALTRLRGFPTAEFSDYKRPQILWGARKSRSVLTTSSGMGSSGGGSSHQRATGNVGWRHFSSASSASSSPRRMSLHRRPPGTKKASDSRSNSPSASQSPSNSNSLGKSLGVYRQHTNNSLGKGSNGAAADSGPQFPTPSSLLNIFTSEGSVPESVPEENIVTHHGLVSQEAIAVTHTLTTAGAAFLALERKKTSSGTHGPVPPLLAPPLSRPGGLLPRVFSADEEASRDEVQPLVGETYDMDSAIPEETRGKLGKGQSNAETCLEHPAFEHAVCILVIINALMIGMETNFKATHRGEDTPYMMQLSEKFFCGIFAFEVSIRLLFLGKRFFANSSWMWNVFDLCVVCLQVLEQSILDVLPLLDVHLNLATLRMVRLLRLLRVTRLMRVLRLIEELRTLAGSIAMSMKSLSFALLLLAMVIYVFSVILLEFVTERLDAGQPLSDDDEFTLRLYFGSLWRTVLTLFEAILSGLSWDLCIMPLIVNVSPACGVLLCFYISFCVFALMNVVTGVFVEKATRMVQDDRDMYLATHIKDLFFESKDEAHEAITWDFFRSKLDAPDMQEYFKAINVDPSEAKRLFALLDADGTGEVDSSELVDGLLRLRGSAKSLDLAILMYETEHMFNCFNKHTVFVEEGFAAISDLLRKFSEAEPTSPTSDEKIQRYSAIRRAGLNSSGQNDYPQASSSWLSMSSKQP